MRLWTLHPRYLDRQGLTAVWREGLLAQAVLLGKTRGYRHHSQLIRLRAARNPTGSIAAYLLEVSREAARRGYRFDVNRITAGVARGRLTETRGQLMYEWRHLRAKLRRRSPAVYRKMIGVKVPAPHPLFRVVPGPVRDWERVRTA